MKVLSIFNTRRNKYIWTDTTCINERRVTLYLVATYEYIIVYSEHVDYEGHAVRVITRVLASVSKH